MIDSISEWVDASAQVAGQDSVLAIPEDVTALLIQTPQTFQIPTMRIPKSGFGASSLEIIFLYCPLLNDHRQAFEHSFHLFIK